MKREEILDLLNTTLEDDDAGFQKIISSVLDGKFFTIKELACEFGVSLVTVKNWRDGKSFAHPYLRNGLFKRLKEELII